ncbi:MAG: rhomboid family intramembrane serine protease [Gammaproteobacteria bacterium]|nr:rhomboid family intramembrane serine protease [Gammaproteobacteria bacterium]
MTTVTIRFKQCVLTMFSCLAFIWAVSLTALTSDDMLLRLALIPRSTDGLIGVLTMPLVHHSLPHLLVNTAPFVVMTTLIVLRGVRYYLVATFSIILLGGILVWFFARPGAHVGASGLLFGYFGFLLVRGLFDRRISSIVIAIAVGISYGGIIWGVLPRDGAISWEAHLFGLAAGAFVARAMARFPTAETGEGGEIEH